MRVEFGVSKCKVLVLNRGRAVNLNGLVLPNNQMMKEIDEDTKSQDSRY